MKLVGPELTVESPGEVGGAVTGAGGGVSVVGGKAGGGGGGGDDVSGADEDGGEDVSGGGGTWPDPVDGLAFVDASTLLDVELVAGLVVEEVL